MVEEHTEDKNYPSEEQGILPEERREEIEEEMEAGKKDEDTYTEEGREHLVEDGEITPTESAFMEGYNKDEARCAKCSSLLEGVENKSAVIEREVKGEILRFCSDKCAESYIEYH